MKRRYVLVFEGGIQLLGGGYNLITCLVVVILITIAVSDYTHVVLRLQNSFNYAAKKGAERRLFMNILLLTITAAEFVPYFVLIHHQ